MSRSKTVVFSVVAVVLFFALVEIALWAAGVTTLLEQRDPFAGFSGMVHAFEPDPASGRIATSPRAVAHSFNPQSFRLHKPENGLRIFVLGGSSAYGFPWGANEAFPRFLAEALEASRPERTVEVVNAAAMSYGSHRLRILAAEILQYDPDLLIVYGGHNEFVERRFYRDRIDRPRRLDLARLVLARWRLYSALVRLYERRLGPPPRDAGNRTTGELLGIDVVREHSVDVDDASRAGALRHFEDNLSALLELARKAGVPVVLCTVPSNLRGWAPNRSAFGPGVPPAARAEVRAALEDAREALDAGDPATAIEPLRRALEAAPGHADALFLLGRAYDALGNVEQARRAFVAARDHDAKPTRATTAINETIRRLAREHGALLVDIERTFDAAAEAGVPGFDLIQDYVHPTPGAHRRIARELWLQLEGSGLVGPPRPADEALFESSVTEADVPVAQAASPALVFNLGVILENQGRIEEAQESYRRARDLDPRFYVEGGFNLARLLYRQQRYDEAAAVYREVLDVDPEHLKSLIGLGEALRGLDRIDEARAALERATAVDPGSAPAWNRYGVALAQLDRHGEAAAAFRRAVELEPTDPGFRADLGFALLFEKDLEGAAEAFQASLARQPQHRRARNGLAAVLAERGDLDAAERIFRENLETDPDDAYARAGLDAVERRRAAGRLPGRSNG
jgi:tetratricopeptide (TPR) repeat protein